MKCLFVSLSAIPLSAVKKYARSNLNHYSNIFNRYGTGKGKEKYRIYIPLDDNKPVGQADPPEVVVADLKRQGYEVENYIAGIARKSGTNKSIRIGKILKSEEAKKTFESDPKRKAGKVANNELIAVISRHPYDIVGMSFDRGWTSCMNLATGNNKKYLMQDVKGGTLVAYLIRNSDKNINNPIARVLLKPMEKVGDSSHTILNVGKLYGDAPPKFIQAVEKFKDWANSGSPAGLYKLKKGLYNDHDDDIIHGSPDTSDIPKRNWFELLNTTTNEDIMRKFLKQGYVGGLPGNEDAPTDILREAFGFVKKWPKSLKNSFVGNSNAPEDLKLQLMRSDKGMCKFFYGTATYAETLVLLAKSRRSIIRSTKEAFVAALNEQMKEGTALALYLMSYDISGHIVPLKELPYLEQYIKEFDLLDKCIEFKFLDAQGTDRMFKLCTESKQNKVKAILEKGNLESEDLKKYVKMAGPKNAVSWANFSKEFIKAYFSLYGDTPTFMDELMNNAEEVDVSIYELIRDNLSIDQLCVLVVRVDSEVAKYILNTCSEDLRAKLSHFRTIHRKN